MVYNLLIILFLFCGNFFCRKFPLPKLNLRAEESTILFDINLIEFISAGNQRMIAMFYWIDTLINADLERQPSGKSNWMFGRFNTIHDLDPQFYSNYIFGGQYLSVIKDDIKGASQIFDFGLMYYPNDPNLIFYSAMHYFIEEKNSEKAIFLLEKLRSTKNPRVLSLLARLYSQNDNLDKSYQLLLEAYEISPDLSVIKQRYHDSLYALRAEKDLECLNQQIAKNCSQLDFDGQPYIKRRGQFEAKNKWLPYRR